VDPATANNTRSAATTSNQHETIVKEEGSCRRNITRKDNHGLDVGKYDSARKRMGGAGKGKWTQALDGSDTLPITDLDVNDPLYDEETLEGAVLVSSSTGNNANGLGSEDDNGNSNISSKVYDPVADRVVYGPMLTLTEFKIRVTDVSVSTNPLPPSPKKKPGDMPFVSL